MTSSESPSPRVTVLTTVFNGERYLDEMLASIRSDGFDDYEHIVVDDGSTDSTPDILARWAACDRRVVVVRQQRNRGIPAASNAGLAIARGHYVARLDADDVSLPGRLARQAAFLDEHPEVALVSMNYELMRSDGTVLRRTHHDDSAAVLRYLLIFGNSIGGHSQVMYRRETVLAVGGYSEECPFALDYDLWTRLVECGDFVILPEIGMRYRLHDGSVSVRSRQKQREISEAISRRMLTRYLGREVSEDEEQALAQSWKGIAPARDLTGAQKVLREAFGLLRHRDGATEATLKAVRRVTAWRLITTAAVLFGERDLRGAVRHGLAAAGWDAPAALASGTRLFMLAMREILGRRRNAESRRG